MSTKLLASQQQSRNRSSIGVTKQSNWLETPLDEPMRFIQPDSKKQVDLVRVLELIRLKSQSIKMDQARFKQNLKICAYVAKYLQYLCECVSGPADKTTLSRDSETIK